MQEELNSPRVHFLERIWCKPETTLVGVCCHGNNISTNAQRSKVQRPDASHDCCSLLQRQPCHLATWPERERHHCSAACCYREAEIPTFIWKAWLRLSSLWQTPTTWRGPTEKLKTRSRELEIQTVKWKEPWVNTGNICLDLMGMNLQVDLTENNWLDTELWLGY